MTYNSFSFALGTYKNNGHPCRYSFPSSLHPHTWCVPINQWRNCMMSISICCVLQHDKILGRYTTAEKFLFFSLWEIPFYHPEFCWIETAYLIHFGFFFFSFFGIIFLHSLAKLVFFLLSFFHFFILLRSPKPKEDRATAINNCPLPYSFLFTKVSRSVSLFL